MPDPKESRLKKYMDYIGRDGPSKMATTNVGTVLAGRPSMLRRAVAPAASSVGRAAGRSARTAAFAEPVTGGAAGGEPMTEDEQKMLDAHLRGTRGAKQRSAAEMYASKYRSK